MCDQANPETITVAISEIDIPAGIREPIPATVAGLADSIEAEGLLQPIGLRQGGGERYTLIFGGQRLAAHHRLGRTMIEARVFEMGEEEAESATIAENLYRTRIKPADRLRFVKRWQEIYARAHPEATGRAVGGLARAKKRRGLAMSGMDIAGGESPAAEEAGQAAPRFDRVVSRVMGVSGTSARRDAHAAKVLSEADLDVLGAREVSAVEIGRIVALKDEAQRQGAVARIASGLDVATALAAATAPENSTVNDGEDLTTDVKPEAERTDEEWLDHDCEDALARLVHQVTFRKDAIVWRKSVAHLDQLRNQTRRLLDPGRAFKPGPFASRMADLLDLLHPNDWPACGPCGGTGRCGNISECPNCHGHAYALESGGGR